MENKKVINNFFWRFAERFGAQGVSFVVSIILARLLEPSVYGIVALATVVTTIIQVFVDSGFGNSLIQKKDADQIDFSTVFFFNIITSIVLYALLYCFAPLISRFYGMSELTPVIRALGLTLIVSGVKNIQHAYVAKNMLFKRFFYSTLGGTIGAAVIGITMALSGFGVWALIAQNLFNTFVSTVILWFTVKWRPIKAFSFERLKGLFSYGWKLLVSSLIETVYNDIRQLIIGKIYTSNDLAFYNKGKQMPQLLITNVNTSIDSVLLPAMSAEQNDRERVKAMTRRAIKTSSYLIVPAMVGLAVCAEPLIRLLLTEKWLPCVVYLRIFCFTFAFRPIHTANLNAIKAIGRSDIFLKLEIIKKIFGMIALFATIWVSVEAMAYSLLFTTILNSVINAYPNKSFLNYGYREQLVDMLPTVLLAGVMAVAVYVLSYLPTPDIIILAVQVIAGVTIYVLGSVIFKLEPFKYICATVKKYTKRTR